MKQKYSGKAEEPIMIMSESVTEQSLSQTPLFSMGVSNFYVKDKDVKLAENLGNHYINEDEGFVKKPNKISGHSLPKSIFPQMEDEVQQTQNPTEKFNSMAEKFKSLTKSLKMKMTLPLKQKNSNFLFKNKFQENTFLEEQNDCLLYTSPSPRDLSTSRMPSSA